MDDLDPRLLSGSWEQQGSTLPNIAGWRNCTLSFQRPHIQAPLYSQTGKRKEFRGTAWLTEFYWMSLQQEVLEGVLVISSPTLAVSCSASFLKGKKCVEMYFAYDTHLL